MARRRPLWGVQQAGLKIGLSLEALSNIGKKVRVEAGEGVIVDHVVEKRGVSLLVRYQVRVRRVGLMWQAADGVVFG